MLAHLNLYERKVKPIMPTPTKTAKAPAATFVSAAAAVPAETPAAPVETPAAPVDPFAGLTVYGADAFVPPPPSVSPTVVQFLELIATSGREVVIIDGWDKPTVDKFLKQCKSRRDLVGGRRIYRKDGTVEGKAAMLLTLSGTADTAETTTE